MTSLVVTQSLARQEAATLQAIANAGKDDDTADPKPEDPAPEEPAAEIDLDGATATLATAVHGYDGSAVSLNTVEEAAAPLVNDPAVLALAHRVGLAAVSQFLSAWVDAHPGFEESDEAEQVREAHNKVLRQSGIQAALNTVVASGIDGFVETIAASIVQDQIDDCLEAPDDGAEGGEGEPAVEV